MTSDLIMPMPPYPIACYSRGCGKLAVYKIASHWSDGVTGELKTYSLSCEECLPDWFRRSRAKQAACRLAAGETLEPPGIYSLERGRRDKEIHRLRDLEEDLLSEKPGLGPSGPGPRSTS
jgi:hypothetical protein